jgi:hypothetical protein
LQDFPPDHPQSSDQAQNCYLPVANNAGLLRPWTALSPSDLKPESGISATLSGVKTLGAFLYQIVNTARGWVDAAQLVMPGYRDRVVTIYHNKQEGGMNLSMPSPVVTELSERGQAAATLLVDKFAGTAENRPRGWGWNNQRWIRFRTATAGLNAWLTRFQTAYHTPVPGALPYTDLAGPGAGAALPSYGFSAGPDRSAVNDLTAGLLTLGATWGTGNGLSVNAPRPQPQLRLTPDDGVASSVAERAADTPTQDQAPQA